MKKFCSKPLNFVSIPGYSLICWLKSNRVKLDNMQENFFYYSNHGMEGCMSKAHTKTIYIKTNIYDAFFNNCKTIFHYS